jgi:hypothetical protein
VNSVEQTQRATLSQRDDTVATCRRAIVIVRYLLAVATAAVLVSNWISVTSSNIDGNGSPGTPGKIQIARYLNAIALPLVLIAAVLALSVMAAIYIERLHTESAPRITLPEHEQSGITANPAALTAAPRVPVRQLDEHDDSAWRRS